jgi:NADH dehydrogenase FAD-containing subunit
MSEVITSKYGIIYVILGNVAAKNIVSAINGKREGKKKKFDYKTKGIMAEIGKRIGVAILFGRINTLVLIGDI